MKKAIAFLALIVALIALPACDWFGGEEDEIVNRGEYKPGPVDYTGNDGRIHHCNPPGGWCSSDNRCHSRAENCPEVK